MKVAAGAVAALALVAAGGFAMTSRPVPVRIVQPERDVRIRVFGLGTVEAQVIAKVGFEVGATLVEVKADHGDRVSKGDVLALLQSSDQAAKLAKANAGVTSAEVAIRRAEANIAKTKAILSQKAQVNRRRQALAERNTVSQQTVEEAQKDEDVAQADLAVAAADLDVLKSTVADARAQASFERSMLDHYTLRAPFDAIVVERTREPGAVIKIGDPIYTLVAPETVWILAYIDEQRSGDIAVGQPAEVRLRSLPQLRFQGRVVRIGIESDRVTEERRVWVKCNDCPTAFHLGEQAEVLITTTTLPTARLVPESAVQGFDGNLGQAWVIENGRAVRRPLAFAYRTEDARLALAREVPDTLAVVAEPGTGIAENRPVRILDGGKP